MRSLLPMLGLIVFPGCRESFWFDVDSGSLDDTALPGDTGPIDDGCDDGQEPTTFFADDDGDGFGVEGSTVEACVLPEGYAAEAGDCDDSDVAFYPGAPETDCTDANDYNCDGSAAAEDNDNDGFPACEDCDDTNVAINPNAFETCGGGDEDCDGQTDEAGAIGEQMYYADADADGFGNAAVTATSCVQPAGHVTDATDCDDAQPLSHPGRDEICDSLDNDCDGTTDVDAIDEAVWYEDIDADGFGASATALEACDAPSGFIADATDCDDLADTVYPGAPELCDALDNDCDGDVDEDATGLGNWYRDSDGDGYGDISDSLTTCEQPVGYVANSADCDDGSEDISPVDIEVCDGVDNDCSGEVDEATATDARTWHVDADGDTYGTSDDDVVACEAPDGWVDNTDDCDDVEAAVNPAATEVCDTVDNDCNGQTDEPAASDASDWFHDGDSDSFGDSTDSQRACTQPADFVADATDCDDDDAAAYPGADDYAVDGVDNDCDGEADQDWYLGSAADGGLQVGALWRLDTDVPSSRTTPWAVRYGITDIDGLVVGVDAEALGLAPDDEVLIINLQGSQARHAAVGRFAFHRVASVSAEKVTLTQSVTTVFGESSNADLTDQVVVLQRVPNFEWVNVAVGQTLTASAWDGGGGGVLAFRARDAIAVRVGAAATTSELGYWGGDLGSVNNCDGTQGESYTGLGTGASAIGCTGGYNGSNGTFAYRPNGGGGGCHITGGGGNHAGGAQDGDAWSASAEPPQAGLTYGSADLTTLFFGSGGGGLWNGSDAEMGPGADGAGIVYMTSSELLVVAGGSIHANGQSATGWSAGNYTYGAGGGAGGTVWLLADEMTLPTDSVLARGGSGQQDYTRDGGNGGAGRIRVDFSTLNGHSEGTPSATAAVAVATAPDAGFFGPVP